MLSFQFENQRRMKKFNPWTIEASWKNVPEAAGASTSQILSAHHGVRIHVTKDIVLRSWKLGKRSVSAVSAA